jgi:hypothetical protein
MFRKVSILICALMMTGCQNVRHALFPGDPPKPGTDPATVCRSPSGTAIRDVTWPLEPLVGQGPLTDNTSVLTGETNGEDGVTEVVTLCKRDLSGNLVNCQDVTGTGVLSDGTMIEFAHNTVEVKLAQSNGWANLKVFITWTCHG